MRAPDEAPLPSSWPSAWPSLWRPVRDRAGFVALTILLVVLGLAFVGDLGLSWWVALLPLLLLAGPVTYPGRVRRAFQRAAGRGTLSVRKSGDGLWVSAAPRSVVARVTADGGVTYRRR